MACAQIFAQLPLLPFRTRLFVTPRFSTTGLFLLTGLACGSSCSTAPSETLGEAWSQDNSLSFDGLERSYALYVPSEGDPQGLVVLLHGSGQSMAQMISETQVEGTADENSLIVVVPAGVDGGWNDEDPPGGDLADDVGFVDALVTDIKTAYPSLPSHHVFAHGFSNGGGLATRLACESRQIRGVGVIGNYYMPLFDGCPRPIGDPVPGWFGAGVDDELVQVETVRESMPSYAVDLTDCATAGSLQVVEAADVPSGVVCKELSGCDLARLCEYENSGHEVLEGSLSAAWEFLRAAAVSSDSALTQPF